VWLAAFASAAVLLALSATVALWVVRPASQRARLHTAGGTLVAANAPPAPTSHDRTLVQPATHAVVGGPIAPAPSSAGRTRAGRSQRTGRAIAPETAGAQEDGRPHHDWPRQLQFTAPGGTRLVWVLDPNFALPAKAAQQEEPRWSAE